MLGLVVVAAVLRWWDRKEGEVGPARAPTWVALALAVTAVVAATGTTFQAIRVGHSGATAVWVQTSSSTKPPLAQSVDKH